MTVTVPDEAYRQARIRAAKAGTSVSVLVMPYAGRPGTGFAALGQREHPNYPEGSLRSSVVDLARFVIMTTQRSQYTGVRILQPATVDAMLRRQVPDLDYDQATAGTPGDRAADRTGRLEWLESR